MKLAIVGKVYFKSEIETIGANQIKKQIVVVETDGEYPQKFPVEFIKDKVDLLNNAAIGQNISIQVNARGNEYKDKNGITRFGLSFQGWKID